MLGSLFFTVASGATWPVPGAQLIKRSEMNGRRVIGSGTEKKEAGLGRLRPPLFFRSVITIALRLPNRTPETGKEKPKIFNSVFTSDVCQINDFVSHVVPFFANMFIF